MAAQFGYWLLSAAVVVHLAAIGLACKEFGGLEWFTLRGGIVLTAVLLAGAYLVVQRFYHLPSVGAFVTPLTLVILLPTLFGEGGSPGVAPEALRHPAITFHIMTASAGVALFGLAFGVALMYLLQEREVKGKHFGALFSRLPPLSSLDKLIDRLIRLGFLSFSVAIVAGAVIARSVWKSAWSWDPQQISSLVIWLLYGGMVKLRHSGWHGRRYAQLTLVGFAMLMVSMVVLRSVPGLTMHAGEYKGPGAEAVK
jgi:ABC-type transport system involved in cytochrome c biogenesis permease subunit